MHEFKWTHEERVVARTAFDQALNRELCEIVGQAKEMAASLTEASDLRELENWLRERRCEIERKYDFRYSVLPIVFATLMKQRYLSESDLDGLDQEKIHLIPEHRITTLNLDCAHARVQDSGLFWFTILVAVFPRRAK